MHHKAQVNHSSNDLLPRPAAATCSPSFHSLPSRTMETAVLHKINSVKKRQYRPIPNRRKRIFFTADRQVRVAVPSGGRRAGFWRRVGWAVWSQRVGGAGGVGLLGAAASSSRQWIVRGSMKVIELGQRNFCHKTNLQTLCVRHDSAHRTELDVFIDFGSRSI